MSNFRYIAIDAKGHRQEGTLEALTLEEAGQAIRKKGHKIIRIHPTKSKGKKFKLSEINITPPKIDTSMKVVFFRQLSTLVNAGIQLDDGLSILELQFKDKHFSKVIRDVSKLVKTGTPFSGALKQHSRVFPKLVVSLIKAAEAGGGMGNILNQISLYIEKEEKTRKKLKSATSYPKFIMGFFTLVLAGVVFGLLPKFKDIYASFDAQLPGSTLIILAISDFLRNNLLVEIILIALLVTGFIMFKKSSRGRRFVDQHIFKLPIAGSLIHKSVITRMTQTLSVLLKSGVSLINALTIASETTDNVYVEEVVDNIGTEISHGKTFSSQLSLYPNLFPLMVSGMIGVGEKSGALAIMLEKIAEFTERDLNSKVDTISNTMEPILMGGLGIVVCIIVLALYLPIFQMTGAIK